MVAANAYRSGAPVDVRSHQSLRCGVGEVPMMTLVTVSPLMSPSGRAIPKSATVFAVSRLEDR